MLPFPLAAAAIFPLAVSKGASGTLGGSTATRSTTLAIGLGAGLYFLATRSTVAQQVGLGAGAAFLAMLALHARDKAPPK